MRRALFELVVLGIAAGAAVGLWIYLVLVALTHP